MTASELFYMPKRQKRHERKRPCRKKRTEESEWDDSECDSICSFDSEVCLAGIEIFFPTYVIQKSTYFVILFSNLRDAFILSNRAQREQ